MREITAHHDGHGLNESIKIEADLPDHSGASHYFVLSINGANIGRIQFQQGPRNLDDSTPGATEAAILAIIADRLQGFQSGPFACHENEVALDYVRVAMGMMRYRADERAKRGVLGQNIK